MITTRRFKDANDAVRCKADITLRDGSKAQYGGMRVTGNDGKTVNWLWDYASDQPVHDTEMPFGSERHKLSERAKYRLIQEHHDDPAATP